MNCSINENSSLVGDSLDGSERLCCSDTNLLCLLTVGVCFVSRLVMFPSTDCLFSVDSSLIKSALFPLF